MISCQDLNDDILLGCIQYNLRMQIMWSFTSNGTYAVPSLYAVINHRGFTPVFVSAIWKLNVPPRIHFFLWAALLAAAARSTARPTNEKLGPLELCYWTLMSVGGCSVGN